MTKPPIKVIKATKHIGHLCQDYGIEITDNWTNGTHDKCVKEIRKTLRSLWQNRTCPSKEKLFFIDGLEKEYNTDNEILDAIRTACGNKDSVTIRTSYDDMYSSVYETTFMITPVQSS